MGMLICLARRGKANDSIILLQLLVEGGIIDIINISAMRI
jgi:hypothetical protein